MDKLFKGVKAFNEREFFKHQALFSELKDKQEPHTLFVGCSDSRIVPHAITGSLPGELFIIRNIANIVPPYEEAAKHVSTVSSLEYAVEVLKVQNIVICGHSDCGGCKALARSKEEMNFLPHTHDWLVYAKEAYRKVKDNKSMITCDLYHEEGQKDRQLKDIDVVLENVVLQMKHIYTYPKVNELVEADRLNVFGWYYDIGHGSVYNYDEKKHHFGKIK